MSLQDAAGMREAKRQREIAYFRKYSCEVKQRYSTLMAADHACTDLRAAPDYKPSPGGLMPYQCVFDPSHWQIGRGHVKTQNKVSRVRRFLTELAAGNERD